MRLSLKRLARRDPAKPTLRQRAAALKASAARVIGRRRLGQVTGQPEGESLPHGRGVDGLGNAFTGLGWPCNDHFRLDDDPSRTSATGDAKPYRENDMGQPETNDATTVSSELQPTGQPQGARDSSPKERAATLRARLARITRRSDEADPQRRTILAGSLAAAMPLPALAHSPHPDAELLALGHRLDEATRAYLAIRPRHLDLQKQEQAAISQTYAVHGTLDSEVGLNFCITLIAPFKAELDRCNEAQEAVNSLCDAVFLEHRATTLEGAAAVARAVAANHFDQWAIPQRDRDWTDIVAMSLADAVLRIAQVENVAAGLNT